MKKRVDGASDFDNREESVVRRLGTAASARSGETGATVVSALGRREQPD